MIWRCRTCGLEVDADVSPNTCEACGWDDFERDPEDLRIEREAKEAAERSAREAAEKAEKAARAARERAERRRRVAAERAERSAQLRANKKRVIANSERFFANAAENASEIKKLEDVRKLSGSEVDVCINRIPECKWDDDVKKTKLCVVGQSRAPVVGAYWATVRHGFIFKTVSKCLVLVYHSKVDDLRIAMTKGQLDRFLEESGEQLSSIKYVAVGRDKSDLSTDDGTKGVYMGMHLNGIKYVSGSKRLELSVEDRRVDLFS